jgi:cysteinyl-tRNA synthetase
LSEDAGPSTSTMSEPEIHELLAERLQAKMSRDFQVADEIQSQLISSGVFVHDGRKEWRADGVAYGDGDGRPGRTPGSRNDRNRLYAKSVHSPPLKDGTGTDQLVTVLVQERNKYKQLRDFAKADAIREGLRTKFNVLVDDRLREWSVGGDFGPEHEVQREMADAFAQRGYVKSASSQPLEAEQEAYIQEKVQERAQAKKNRDFDLADSLREELNQEYSVMINDKLKLWSVGGDFGADGGPSKPRGTYTRRGGGDLTEDEVETITNRLAERFRAKKNRDFDTADVIRDELRDRYNVKIDDKAAEWNVDIDEYVQISVPGGIALQEETVDKIQALIVERFQSKVDRGYERADEIRDELEETYNVIVDDRTKEWRCLSTTDSDDKEPSYTDRQFVDGAVASQKSAFKRTQGGHELDS